MEINTNRIRKLADKELLNSFKKANIYTSDTVLFAVEILEKERNYLFSDLEKQNIEKVVNDKNVKNIFQKQSSF